ncbi:MAG TPA: HD domain-containing protein [Firmicutes bacterium]|nr:HD domain-containing protein [Bacillota bacterium]
MLLCRNVRDVGGGSMQLMEILEQKLSPKTLLHTRNVAATAAKLAAKEGLSTEKAYLAGLLHDYAKDMTAASLLSEAMEAGIKLDYVLEAQPLLLHGPVGARLIQREYGITDREVLEAVERHTCGSKDMGPIARVVYLADIIEPARDFPGVDTIRSLADGSLTGALIAAVEITLNRVLKRRLLIHPDSISFWNELLRE